MKSLRSTQSVLDMKIKKGKLSTSHRSAPYRCFDQDLAEFGACWSCRTYPAQRYEIFLLHNASAHVFFVFLYHNENIRL